MTESTTNTAEAPSQAPQEAPEAPQNVLTVEVTVTVDYTNPAAPKLTLATPVGTAKDVDPNNPQVGALLRQFVKRAAAAEAEPITAQITTIQESTAEIDARLAQIQAEKKAALAPIAPLQAKVESINSLLEALTPPAG